MVRGQQMSQIKALFPVHSGRECWGREREVGSLLYGRGVQHEPGAAGPRPPAQPPAPGASVT